MRLPAVWLPALLAGLLTDSGALAAGTRPTAADIAACREFAQMQPDIPAYTETTPANPSRWRGIVAVVP